MPTQEFGAIIELKVIERAKVAAAVIEAREEATCWRAYVRILRNALDGHFPGQPSWWPAQ